MRLSGVGSASRHYGSASVPPMHPLGHRKVLVLKSVEFPVRHGLLALAFDAFSQIKAVRKQSNDKSGQCYGEDNHEVVHTPRMLNRTRVSWEYRFYPSEPYARYGRRRRFTAVHPTDSETYLLFTHQSTLAMAEAAHSRCRARCIAIRWLPPRVPTRAKKTKEHSPFKRLPGIDAMAPCANRIFAAFTCVSHGR
jgi:hypothetical protein